MISIQDALTPGAIARQLEQPWWRINHILESRNIAPAGKVGNVRVFGPEVVDRIRAEIRAIDAKRGAAISA